ncbi:MAG: hypothetical protein LBL86_00680 [Coriobacteriales bacterium]|jgi:hypothetical protein|nr:hypothetical protein [Coriobacteriales bacterium]
MRRKQHSTNEDAMRQKTRHKKKNPSLWTGAVSFALVGLLAITTFGGWGALLSSESGEALAQEAAPAEDETAASPEQASLAGETPTLPEITLGGGGGGF